MLPCSVNNWILCCKQVISTSTLKSQQTNKSYTIFHEVNCSNAYVIYLMECTLYKKQYVGLNSHREDFKKPNNILACRHFQERNHIFNKQTKFVFIDKLTNIARSKDIFRQKLIEREKFWI